MSGTFYRGLHNFISEIRSAPSKEQEEKRVNKELANIRKKFRKTDLDGYNKKKYIWKLLYCHLLGYEVEFGHMEAINLVTSTKYSEKSVGYVAMSLLVTENDDVLRLIINTILQDIDVSNNHNNHAQCLALAAISNVGGIEFADALSNSVQALLTSPDASAVVRKKAALCLLRLFRRQSEIIVPEEHASKLVKLLNDSNTAVVMASLSLLRAVCMCEERRDEDDQPISGIVGFEEIVPRAVKLMVQIVINRDFAPDYVYANVPCPWLQVKTLQILQLFPAPTEVQVVTRLTDVLTRILGETHPVKNVNRNNTTHAILFEAIKLIIELNFNPELLSQAAGMLGRFVSMKDSNFKYLGLEAMARLAKLPNGSDYIRRHQDTVVTELGNPDISIRRRALDLAYEMCDTKNVSTLVDTLLNHLDHSDYAIREELVLKISVLASRYSQDHDYVTYVMRLIEKAGDFVEDDIWHRAVRVVHANDEIQESAAQLSFEYLQAPILHASMCNLASVILGEFGHLIQGIEGCSLQEQLKLLHHKIQHSDKANKCNVFSAMCKFATLDRQMKQEVKEIAQTLVVGSDADLQQRAVEFCVLADDMPHEMFQQVYENMPPYREIAEEPRPSAHEHEEEEHSLGSEGYTPAADEIANLMEGSPSKTVDGGIEELYGGAVSNTSQPLSRSTTDDLADLFSGPPAPALSLIHISEPTRPY
eukprot:TRINITY_DN6821_c0_g1_i1.p1 TRINITY_DN6821_c0_g1~~TRINITY_DN6821_c0_g1_i1.p1  ORF type:complete len:704 (+),score=253.92 TRINITY_DN6821_c0_g1_i1:193-2304(+)